MGKKQRKPRSVACLRQFVRTKRSTKWHVLRSPNTTQCGISFHPVEADHDLTVDLRHLCGNCEKTPGLRHILLRF